MQVILDNLTKLEQGKYKQLLDKLYYFNGSVKKLGELLDSGEFIGKEFSEVEYKSGPKKEYMFKCKSGGYLTVPKIFYKAVEFSSKNLVNIGGLKIIAVNEKTIAKIAIDDLNAIIKECRDNDDYKQYFETIKTFNFQKISELGAYVKVGLNTFELPISKWEFIDLVNEAILNDFIIEVKIDI